MLCPDCRHNNIEGVDNCANCGRELMGLDIPSAAPKPGAEFVYERLAALPPKPPFKVASTDPVGMALRHLQHGDAECVLVMEGTQLAGILTLRDVLHKVAGQQQDVNAVTCGQVMTADPVFLREDDNVAVAINKMSVGGFRHIPLLEGGSPVSVIGVADIFRYISPHLL